MRKTLFLTITSNLPGSVFVTDPENTGYTFKYRQRSIINFFKYNQRTDTISGYIQINNLKRVGIDIKQYLEFDPAQLTKKGNIKLALLSDNQLNQIVDFICVHTKNSNKINN
jgi:hypothetical protein